MEELDALLRDLARRIRPQVHQVADHLFQRMATETPLVWEHEDLVELSMVSGSEHLKTGLDLLEGKLSLSDVTAPPAAIEFASRLADRGVQMSELLRTYRLAHAETLQLLFAEASRLTSDPDLRIAAVSALVANTFGYIDRTSEQAVTAYQEAHDRRLQRRLIVINEASRRIGTTLDIGRTAQELAEMGVESLADLVTVDLLDFALHEEDTYPPADASVLRRIAQRSKLEGCPESAVSTGQRHRFPEGSALARAMATGQPMLHRVISPELPKTLAGTVDSDTLVTFGIHSMLLIPLWARGIPLGLAQFFRHRCSAPFDDDDLLLAQEIASRAAVYIDNARRYTQERSTALTLQHSLLPQRVSQHPAIETAARYLPCGARAGVGGDWYDVIALSGARVALVIGDVVGRGLYASATMGRLRTAVRTLADIDLMPDELLTHLDDVVIRLQREESQDPDEISATCLYAVYDPVSRMCSMASAGHVAPAVVAPWAANGGAAGARAVSFPEIPIGPPLGLGGLPFETAQFELPEGSLLALYTDGLIEGRTRNVDTGLTQLREVLSQAPEQLEGICDQLLAKLQPSRPTDDIALLVARTRALDAGRIATLDLPSDDAIVAQARARVADQLAAWELEDLSFTTELIVSELVTNAIRYGQPPISLRMILQSTLTCEVADASSTSPHLRRARVFDEGGRGLLLVAQFAEHWGTRHTRDGKVIWAELSLQAGY